MRTNISQVELVKLDKPNKFCQCIYMVPVAQLVVHGTSNASFHEFDSKEMHELIKSVLNAT